MEAFNLWYAVGSLIAAAVTGLVILIYLPVSELIRRNRFEGIFGFPPLKGKRTLESRSISWWGRQKVRSYLSTTAYEMAFNLKQRHFSLKWALKALVTHINLEDERNKEYKAGMATEFQRLFRGSISSHIRYLRERRKFHRAYELAKSFGFEVHDDYSFYARLEADRKAKEFKQAPKPSE